MRIRVAPPSRNYGKIELITAAEFGLMCCGQTTQHGKNRAAAVDLLDPMAIEDRKDAIVEQIGRRDRLMSIQPLLAAMTA